MFCLIKIENSFSRFCRDVYTIEYQKRNLPHIYLLIFFKSVDEFLEAFHIDEVIYAKLLIIETDSIGELTRILTSIILHSLCGEINPNSFCMSNT